MLFLVILFLIKNNLIFQNNLFPFNEQAGLAYGNTTIGDLAIKDTDGDGIPDWEESLWGTDPNKKESTPGIPDSVTIEKLKSEQLTASEQGLPSFNAQNTENLTQTDKFSREFFTTVATLNQNGTMDQATVDQLGSSLAEQIQNSAPRKIYLMPELKIVNDDSVKAFQKYSDTLTNIFPKTAAKYTVLDVLQKFSADENNVNVDALIELDPIIKQTQNIIDGMVKMNVPQSLSILHLSVINAFERLLENMNDIKLYETDTIVALGGIGKYNQNANTLVSDLANLNNVMVQKLKKL